jgi:hypothetical protein
VIKPPKQIKCRMCGELFLRQRPMQKVCSSVCAHRHSEVQAAKVKQVQVKQDRAETAKRKEAIKTRSDYIREAQVAFNAFVRTRDADKPCICCGKPLGTDAIGGGFDCGHYRSIGSAPHLRFNEFNAHGQTKQCNRYGAGRAVDYRIGLINRIGVELVEALEFDNTPAKWSIEELKAIKATYVTKTKVLKAAK